MTTNQKMTAHFNADGTYSVGKRARRTFCAKQAILTENERRSLLIRSNNPHLKEDRLSYLVEITEEAVLSKLSAANAPTKRDWRVIDAAIDEYLDGYELRADEGDHTPTEFERLLIEDAIAGLWSDEEFLALISGAPQASAEADLNLYRQWFDSVQDTNPQYLTLKDYQAAQRLYERLDMRVPDSVLKSAPAVEGVDQPAENGPETRASACGTGVDLDSAKGAGDVALPPRVTDQEIETIIQRLGMSWTGDYWKVEDADLHPMVRALLYRYTEAPSDRQQRSGGVDERATFEATFSESPFEWAFDRYGEHSAWPGRYQTVDIQCAWEAWQARAAIAQQGKEGA